MQQVETRTGAELGERLAPPAEAGGRPLAELARDLRESRGILEAIETQALAGTVEILAGVVGELAATAELLHSMRAVVWLTPEQAAAYVGATSKEAFQKIARQEGIPAHYLTGRLILYNRAELDEWLMRRTSPPGS